MLILNVYYYKSCRQRLAHFHIPLHTHSFFYLQFTKLLWYPERMGNQEIILKLIITYQLLSKFKDKSNKCIFSIFVWLTLLPGCSGFATGTEPALCFVRTVFAFWFIPASFFFSFSLSFSSLFNWFFRIPFVTSLIPCSFWSFWSFSFLLVINSVYIILSIGYIVNWPKLSSKHNRRVGYLEHLQFFGLLIFLDYILLSCHCFVLYPYFSIVLWYQYRYW